MNAQLACGTYVISGGAFSVQGGSTLTAAGPVLIYLSGSSAYVNIANGATVTLTAPTSGTYEGILFYQDRTVASPTASTFAGGATMNLSGSLYSPNALLNINNGSTTAPTGALVVGSVRYLGGCRLQSGHSVANGPYLGRHLPPYLLQ